MLKLAIHMFTNQMQLLGVFFGLSLLSAGGEYPWEFLVGVCHPFLQILTLFQTKKCHCPHPFLDPLFDNYQVGSYFFPSLILLKYQYLEPISQMS